jgi:hypothetical protein
MHPKNLKKLFLLYNSLLKRQEKVRAKREHVGEGVGAVRDKIHNVVAFHDCQATNKQDCTLNGDGNMSYFTNPKTGRWEPVLNCKENFADRIGAWDLPECVLTEALGIRSFHKKTVEFIRAEAELLPAGEKHAVLVDLETLLSDMETLGTLEDDFRESDRLFSQLLDTCMEVTLNPKLDRDAAWKERMGKFVTFMEEYRSGYLVDRGMDHDDDDCLSSFKGMVLGLYDVYHDMNTPLVCPNNEPPGLYNENPELTEMAIDILDEHTAMGENVIVPDDVDHANLVVLISIVHKNQLQFTVCPSAVGIDEW